MSSFICSDAHTNALAQLAEVYDDTAGGRQRVAELLRAANTRSVTSRHSESDEPPPIVYAPSREIKVVSPVQVLKLCACFDYQCSDADNYPQSEAARIVEAIRHRTIAKLSGYEDADWSI